MREGQDAAGARGRPGFAIRQDAGSVIFSIRGEGAGLGFWLGTIFLVIPILGMAATAAFGSLTAFLFVLVAGLGIAIAIDRRRRAENRLRISSEVIEANGNLYEIGKISEVFWGGKDGVVQSASGGRVIVAGTGAALGDALRGGPARRGFQVWIRHGRHAVPLATDLTEDMAAALFHEVNRALSGPPFHLASNTQSATSAAAGPPS